MKTNKDLGYFLKLNYAAVLKKVNDRYYLFIPELSLLAEGESPAQAYEELQQKKEAYFRRAVELGIQDDIREPLRLRQKRGSSLGLGLFFIKTAIVALVFAGVLIAVLPAVDSFVRYEFEVLPQRALRVGLSISERLNRMPQDKKEEALKKIRENVQQLKPFADELKVLFQGGDSGSLQPKD